MAVQKFRADQLVYTQGLAESKEKAKRLIMAGQIMIANPNGTQIKIDKPGHLFPIDTKFQLLAPERFVGRGAYKLLSILQESNLDVHDFTCLDAGASTGGFTDCLLQLGAKKVYAIDVGHNQLHEKLRSDPRVINFEGINLRTVPVDFLPEQVDLIVADVSFISLTLILPPCIRWLKPNGNVIVLIKPQFELGPNETVKGIVRDQSAQMRAVDKITTFAFTDLKLILKKIIPSAIKGSKGNQEYLAWFINNK
ncbi:MAG: TlyA family RNA methyltransferase [Desulfovibrionaceae bacterium]|nr:TlyA family RNA methyltransferase [Desulfovibrionaceae bacterium]